MSISNANAYMVVYFCSIVKTNNSLKKGISYVIIFSKSIRRCSTDCKKTLGRQSRADTALAGHMHKFVETQSEYTKAALNNFESFGIGFAGYSIGKAQESAKKATEWVKKYTPAK
jgi:hypothetical protein